MPSRPMTLKFGKRMFGGPLAVGLALVAILMLGGCGGGIQGKYSYSESDSVGKMTLELKGGGVAVMTLSGGPGESMSTEGTYTAEGEKVTVTLDGDPTVFTLKDGKLVGSGFGETIEFTKE